MSIGIPPGGFGSPFTPPPLSSLQPLQPPLVKISPTWDVIERTSLKELLGSETFMSESGIQKKIPGDIHTTMDINQNSPTFGQIHSTMRINENFDVFHSS